MYYLHCIFFIIGLFHINNVPWTDSHVLYTLDYTVPELQLHMIYRSTLHLNTYVQMLNIDTVYYMFYHKMQISWPDYGSRPIGLLDKHIKTFAEQRGI